MEKGRIRNEIERKRGECMRMEKSFLGSKWDLMLYVVIVC